MFQGDDRGEDGGGGAGLDDPCAAFAGRRRRRRAPAPRRSPGATIRRTPLASEHVGAEFREAALGELHAQAEQHHRDHRAAEQIGRSQEDRRQGDIQQIEEQRRGQAEDRRGLEDGDAIAHIPPPLTQFAAATQMAKELVEIATK